MEGLGQYLEQELKKEIGRGRNATISRNGKRMTTVIEISKKLGLSTTQLKKIKSISNYDPKLIERIDRGKISVNKAYEQVRNKFIRPNRDDKSNRESDFRRKFHSLLREYEPDHSLISDVLSKTYPFSIKDLKMVRNIVKN